MFKQVVAIDRPCISCQTAVPQQRVTPASTRLNFFQCCWLPYFPPRPRLLPNTVSCRSQNSYSQLLATRYSFLVVVARDHVVGSDSLQSLHRRRNTTPPRQPWGCVILLREMWRKWPWPRAVWAPCFGNRTNGNSGKFLKILKQKIY
jgi:hypothetical protein